MDLDENLFKFYNVEVLRLGRGKYQLITTAGKLTGKGKPHLKSFFEYDDVMNEAREKIKLKKKEGFAERVDVKKALFPVFPKGKQPDDSSSYTCDLCYKSIEEDNYRKIKEWARGEGGWDNNPAKAYYQKVLCIECQIEHGVYRKRLKSEKTHQKSSSKEGKPAL